MRKFLGVDGYKGGWLAVILSSSSSEVKLYKDVGSLWSENRDASLVLIDIPICLTNKGIRQCDILARKMLAKNRKPSIFNPPAKKAYYAGSYREACAINKEVTGKKISKQTWNLIPKIKEVNKLISKHPEAVKILKESHPEVCFMALSTKGIKYSKKNILGIKERLKVLESLDGRALGIFAYANDKFSKKAILADDIVDSMVLAFTAKFGYKKLSKIPKKPHYNELGQKAEIVYFSKNDSI